MRFDPFNIHEVVAFADAVDDDFQKKYQGTSMQRSACSGIRGRFPDNPRSR